MVLLWRQTADRAAERLERVRHRWRRTIPPSLFVDGRARETPLLRRAAARGRASVTCTWRSALAPSHAAAQAGASGECSTLDDKTGTNLPGPPSARQDSPPDALRAPSAKIGPSPQPGSARRPSPYYHPSSRRAWRAGPYGPAAKACELDPSSCWYVAPHTLACSHVSGAATEDAPAAPVSSRRCRGLSENIQREPSSVRSREARSRALPDPSRAPERTPPNQKAGSDAVLLSGPT
jgi:hypothetical protein